MIACTSAIMYNKTDVEFIIISFTMIEGVLMTGSMRSDIMQSCISCKDMYCNYLLCYKTIKAYPSGMLQCLLEHIEAVESPYHNWSPVALPTSLPK